jgi:integrase
VGTSGNVRTYRTGSGWRARTTYRDYDGVTREIQRAGRTAAAARRKLSEAIRDRIFVGGNADLTPDSRVSVLAALWMAELEAGDLAPRTREQYQGNIDRCIVPGIGSLRVRELTVSSCERLIRTIEKKRGAATAKTTRSVLSGMCGYAARHEALDRNPVRDTGTVASSPKSSPKALTVAQAIDLRIWLTYDDRAISRDVPDLVDFMLATGLRISECTAVTWRNVDLDNWQVRVVGNVVRLKGIGLVVQVEESDKLTKRTLDLPWWAVEMLERRAATFDGEPDPDAPVFPAPRGGLRDPSNTQADFRDLFAFCGYPWVTSHVFRKTVATLMDDQEKSARAIADQLGHSKPSMTQDKYLARRRTTGAAAVLEVIGDL